MKGSGMTGKTMKYITPMAAQIASRPGEEGKSSILSLPSLAALEASSIRLASKVGYVFPPPALPVGLVGIAPVSSSRRGILLGRGRRLDAYA